VALCRDAIRPTIVFKKNPIINLDLLLVDGCREWHLRATGLACFIGYNLNIPCVGVSKTFLYCGSEHHGKEVHTETQNKLQNHGDTMTLAYQLPDGFEIRCAVMRTTSSDPFKPIFISVGHLINLESEVELIIPLCKFREPEHLRLADRISRKCIKNI
jgi:deoxyinosine 3'endonuclease (endonuclease V)